jgi:hypothetical protein
MARNIVTVTDENGTISPKKVGIDLSETFGWAEVIAFLKDLAADCADFAEFQAKIEAL